MSFSTLTLRLNQSSYLKNSLAMKASNILATALIFLFIFSSCSNASDFQNPEAIIQTVDGHQLKQKHLYAYLDKNAGSFGISAVLDDPNAMASLKAQLLEEFASIPELMILELDDHYDWMQGQSTGIVSSSSLENKLESASESSNPIAAQKVPVSNNTDVNQWNQLLNGSVLVYETSQYYEGMYVQSTQYMHLCPDSSMRIYESSAGGGSAAGMSISSTDQLRLSEVGNWDVVSKGGVTFFRMVSNGELGAAIIKIVNNQIYLQEVGALKYFEGAAQCN